MPKSPEVLLAAFWQAHDQALLDCKTTAAALGHKPRWLAQKAALGEGPPFRRFSRKFLFQKAEVLRWLDKQVPSENDGDDHVG